MSQFFYQQKQAWETLKNNWGFSFAVIMTMGITLGALIAILSLAWLLVVKPLPYPDQDRLFRVDQDMFNATGQRDITAYTYPTLLHLFKNQTEFNDAALVFYGTSVDTSAASQPTLNIAFATHQWFELLGAKFALGRGFDESESIENHIPVAIISYQSWLNDYNKNPDIIDQSVTFNGTSYKVVGVLSQNFHEPQIYGIGRQTSVWLPWEFNAATGLKDSWGSIRNNFTFVGRLKQGMSVSQAEQRITQMIDTLWRDNVADEPFFNQWRLEMKLKSFEDIILGESKTAAYLLLAGIIGLVSIACVNIANLFISKTVQQQKELAIHAALGAKPSQIFGHLFAQTNQLMFFAIVIAIAIATVGFHLFQHYLSNLLPRMDELKLGLDTIGLGVGLMLLFALLFTWVSSRVIDYRELNLSLNSSGKGTGVQVSEKSHMVLIISQVAIATALVFGNLVLLNSALHTINTPLGIDLNNKHSVSLTVRAHAWPSLEETAPFMQDLITELSTLPQIKAINQTSSPLAPFGKRAITIVGTNEKMGVENKFVAPGYFKLMQQPLVEGSAFNKEHVTNSGAVAIVNDVFANYLAPDGSALGMKLNLGGERVLTIIGIVKGMRLPGETEIPRRLYGPESLGWADLIIELKDNQTISRQVIVDMVNRNTTMYSLLYYQDLEEIKNERLFAQITTAITTAVLSVLTFLLAGIGLFGILSYVIQMRRFEIGIRMAIGANRADLIKLIVKESSVPVAFGIVIAVGLLVLVYTLFESQIGIIDRQGALVLFVLTLAMISALSLFACYAPLRKYINLPSIHCLRGSD